MRCSKCGNEWFFCIRTLRYEVKVQMNTEEEIDLNEDADSYLEGPYRCTQCGWEEDIAR